MSAAVASEPQPADPLVSLQHAASQSAGVDSLTCQWLGCGDRSTSPEALYEHVCDKHVGRKSTNNLNLQCQWGNCRTTTVKRDHITSHIRVHVPLKPHKCDFCQKSFKRPQDLKKHVKTHADDSVLLDSPEATNTQRSSISSANYQTGVPKSAGYYTNDNSMGHGVGYPAHAQPSNNYSFGMSNASSSYGPVYYGSAQAAGDYALTESRKRGHDALNEFFGDAKRRLIDANTYQDLGARFGGLASLGLPVGNDYAAGYTGRANDYTTATVYQASMPAAPVNYTLPFSELKTKHDLMSIDQFLEQLQNTVYEHPDQAAASGYAHPGLHQQSTGMYGQRQSLSPGYATHQSSTPGARSSMSLAPSNLDDGTPALTPASYVSTHSPVSAHSHPNAVSPAPRPTGSMYPTLPSLNEMQQFGYSSGAPASGLANAYDDLDSRRRYSGGFLQRAQPARRSPPPQSADSLSRRSSTDAGLSKGVRNVDLSSPKPAAAAPPPHRRRNTGSSDGSSAASADGRSEAWVQNVRIIEALRDFVRARLEKGEFDDAVAASRERAASSSAASPSSPSRAAAEERRSATPTQAQPQPQQADTEMSEAREQKPAGSLYPILRAVEATS